MATTQFVDRATPPATMHTAASPELDHVGSADVGDEVARELAQGRCPSPRRARHGSAASSWSSWALLPSTTSATDAPCPRTARYQQFSRLCQVAVQGGLGNAGFDADFPIAGALLPE